MSKYDYIIKDKSIISNLTNDLLQTVNKYGLTLTELVEDKFEGHIVAHFKLLEDKE